jgi:hypothetical protein
VYNLFWRSPALPFVQKQTPILVPAGAIVSTASSLRFTGKGATNYGKVQQENLLRLLENFAGDASPDYPTVGQVWFDTLEGVLKVCVNTSPGPTLWQQLNSTQVTPPGAPPPTTATLGDSWFSQTGSASGVLYVYTGIGRYPQVDWDATAAGYWPAPATFDLQVILNAQVFGPANTNFNEMYIHGTTAGLPADVAGSVLLDGVQTVVPAGFAGVNYAVTDGLIVVDPTATMTSTAAGQAYFVVRRFDDGRWFYDNHTTQVEFVPTAAMYAIGVCTITEQDDQNAPGVVAATMWSAAKRLTNITQAAGAMVAGAIGGWEQVWPTVEVAGGRLEYEYLYSQLASLIGDPIVFGGSAAEGKSIPYLTNFQVLDASMQAAYATRFPTDQNVFANGTLNSLKVAPNSQDWDALLSACRYAVNRLELPVGAADDVATYPFVQDDLPGKAIAFTDIRALPAARKVRTRVGTITLVSQYQETSNVLRAAINNRYVGKGILGASGVGTPLPTVVATNQASYTANAASFSGTVSHGLAYQFAHTHPDLEAFFYSAGVIQLMMAHTPSGSPAGADAALQLLTSTYGRIRIAADKTYVMSTGPMPALVLVPNSLGFNNFTAGGVVLASITSGASTVVIRGVRESAWVVSIYVDITAGGATTGTFNVLWSYIGDAEQYNNPGPTLVYPVPDVNSTGVHKRGSFLFV